MAKPLTIGGGLSLVRGGDVIRLDLGRGRCDLLVTEEALARRRAEPPPPVPPSQTPWQALYRSTVGQLSEGAVIEEAVASRTPRHNH